MQDTWIVRADSRAERSGTRMKGRNDVALVREVKKSTPWCWYQGGCWIYLKPGHYLLSQGVAPLLPSAHGGLTARFGMVLGVSLRGIGTQVIQKCIGPQVKVSVY